MFSKKNLQELIEAEQPPCVSIYLSTHRAGREVGQDPIRFKNLLARVRGEGDAVLEPAIRLLEDADFWRHQSDGLAVFASPRGFWNFRLPLPFAEAAVVGDHFFLKPLFPLVVGNEPFLILALSQKQVRLLDCTRETVRTVSLPGVPSSLADALKYDDPERQLQLNTHAPTAKGRKAAMFHGHGGGAEDTKNRLARFFQLVDRGLREFLHDRHEPLLLAGVEYLVPIYREVNGYPHLSEGCIPGNPDSRSDEELHQMGLKELEGWFQQSRERAARQFRELSGTGKTSQDLRVVVNAALQGRVETAWVANGVECRGAVDPVRKQVRIYEDEQAGGRDLLDFIAVQTFLTGGEVFAVDPQEVPGERPLAAIFRYGPVPPSGA